MTSIADLYLPPARQVLLYSARLLKDIPEDKFARKPMVGSTQLNINHPAFHFGHLGLYPNRIAGILKLDPAGLKPPQGFQELFQIGSPCHDDPEGKIYPKMGQIVQHFSTSHEKLLSILKDLPDALLLSVNEDERSKERFPIVGAFIVYLLGAHANTHLGQVSAWRRCWGLPAV